MNVRAIRLQAGRVGMGLGLAVAALGIPGSAVAAEDFKHYVSPITLPVFNESPYITNEVRAIYMYNELPGKFISSGGRILMVAVQLRARVTDRLAIIATKDGYADINFDAVLPDEEGFANLAFGAKYAAYYAPEKETFITVGARYEAPTGDLSTAGVSMQGAGDGFLDFFTSGSTVLLEDRLGLEAHLGLDVAMNTDHDSTLLHSAIHADYQVLPELAPGLYGVTEFNLVSTVDEGNRTPSNVVGSFEGFDLVNFGSTKSGTVGTWAIGARYAFNKYVGIGFAYEIPYTSRKDIIDQRITTDAIINF